MTSRSESVEHIGCDVVAPDTIEDARWIPSGGSVVVALLVGAAAGVIAAAFLILVRAEGLVSGL